MRRACWLIALGTSAAFAFSLFATFFPSLLPHGASHGGMAPVYYEAAAVIVALVLLGQVLELRARRATSGAIRALLALAPKTARRVGADGVEADVPLDQVAVGELLRVRPGEKVPVDGIVVEGSTLGARQVVFRITRPLEEAVSVVPGVRRVRSKSIRGATEISMQFAPDTDMMNALQLVQGRVNQIQSDLPAGLSIQVERLTPSVFPILSYNLEGGDPATLFDLARYDIDYCSHRLSLLLSHRVIAHTGSWSERDRTAGAAPMPRPAKTNPSFVCAAASRMSIARVIVRPIPTAGPLIAAITGLGTACGHEYRFRKSSRTWSPTTGSIASGSISLRVTFLPMTD